MGSEYYNREDGTARLSKSGAVYTDVHAAAAADSVLTMPTWSSRVENSLDGGNYDIARSCFLFDTSAIGAGTPIYEAHLRLTFESMSGGSTAIWVVEGLFNNPVVDTDYGAIVNATACGGYFDNPGVGTEEIQLNELGVSWISKTGITKLGLRMYEEIDAQVPTQVNGYGITQTTSPTQIARLRIVIPPPYIYPKPGTSRQYGRVGSLVHIRDVESGVYNLELTFGGLTATPPSTVSSRLSGALGSEKPVDPIPTCPPDWSLRYSAERGWYCQPPQTITARPPMAVSEESMERLTPYAQNKIQWLYSHGYVSEHGVPTPKGIAWAKAHPTQDPYEYEMGFGQ